MSTPKYPSSLVNLVSGVISERNLPLILPVFSPYFALPTTKNVLELASGQGVQISGYSKAFPKIKFYPTECDQYGVEEVTKIVAERGGGVEDCGVLDVMIEEDWKKIGSKLAEGDKFEVVVGTNFLHMVPYPEGPKSIFEHLNNITSLTSHFLVYGPFQSAKGFFSEADEQFDAMIKARPGGSYFGLRSIEGLAEIAEAEGWKLLERVDMPKGNWILIFQRQ